MYEEGGGLDPNAIMVQGTAPAGSSEDCFSQMVPDPSPPPIITVTATNSFPENVGLSLENLAFQEACGEDSATLTNRVAAATAMEIAHQHHLGFKQEKSHNDNNKFDTHFPQQPNHDSSQAIFYFDKSNGDCQNHYQDQQFLLMDQQNGTQNYHSCPTPDLLNLLHVPRCSPTANSSLSFMNPTQKTTNLQNPSFVGGYQQIGDDNTNSSSVLYDPFLHLNLPAQPPAIRELLQSLPHGYSLPASRNDFVFGAGGDDREGSGRAYQDGDLGRDFENGVLEFTQEMISVRKKEGKRNKQFTNSEKQRRVDLGSKFEALGDLIPGPSKTKNDRASVVGDAIIYIKELIRTVNELKLLVEMKRCRKESVKKRKVDDATGDLESCNLKPLGDQDLSYNGCLRSSWLQRKSKDTEVDVRIIDDQVTIKLIQRKKINCLLYASKVLDELELDLQHVAGGHIGDFCSFLFDSKMYEGSSLFASAIANKFVEVMDRNFAAA